MFKQLSILLLTVVMVLCMGISSKAFEGTITADEAANWVRYTVPLPKSIEIMDKDVLDKGSVAVIPPANTSDMLITQAVKELTECLGGTPSGKPDFKITMALGGDEAKGLSKLKNSDQAYAIFPVSTFELRLVALTPRGLYYAAKTLQQLINAKATANTITIPYLTVKDWPDMDERGLWGSDCYAHMKWMGDRKMNVAEQISDEGILPNGTPYAKLKPGRDPMVNEGPLYGIKPVPAVLHLEQVAYKGVFEHYPNLKAKSEKKTAWCYSQPEAPVIIGGWIAELSKLPNVTDVDVWMAENMNMLKGCQCDKCKATGVDPMVLEARAIIRGWELAKKRTGKEIGLRILTSEATEDFNKQIFAELPKGVKVNYYHSLLTYNIGKHEMLRPYLADYAKSGHWLGVCPNIAPIIGWTQPMTGAQFIHYRMNEFISKDISGIIGFAVPLLHFADYNTEAEAEYTWNVNGRSTREFALSYGVRHGYKDPETFADFAEAVGQIEWDAYGSDWPNRAENWLEDPIDVRLKKGTVPGLGETKWDFIYLPFGAIASEKELNDDVALADKAVKLADEMGMERYKQESRVAHGYTYSQKALYELTKLVKNGKVSDADKAEATKSFQLFLDSLRGSCDALPKWEKTVAQRKEEIGNVDHSIQTIQTQIIKPMAALAKELGLNVK